MYDMDAEDEDTYDEMIIIFDGAVELYMILDSGTQIQLDVLGAGSVINPHNMLAKRRHSMSVKCAQATTFYYIKRDRMIEVAKRHQDLL